MRPLSEIWRRLIGREVDGEDIKGALIYLGFEVAALIILVLMVALLGVLISRVF